MTTFKHICVAIGLLGATSAPALAFDKPPLSADQAVPMTAESTISAMIEFDIPVLDRGLEAKVPKRLAKFDDRPKRCWHRRHLGRNLAI